MASNFIMINRKIFEHEFWKEKRPFSKFEAWTDLLQTARYETGEKTDWIKNKPIKYGRGQLPCSIRYLMDRWNWGSITKVENFLKQLKNKDMISIDKGQGQIVVTICKYEDYNHVEKNKRTVKGQQQGQEKDKSNKVKNKEELKSVLDKRKLAFSKTLIPFVDVYGKEMVRNFCDYWTEPNRSFTKMKHELEDTWDVASRLRTWADRDFKSASSKNKSKAIDQSQNTRLFSE